MTYKVQIDDLVRNATAEELAVIKANEAAALAEVKAKADKVLAKAALLERLGITADEAALLLS
jgi:non-ribosomal peptide synthetase component E (peptide arylation enzyme)